MNFFAFLKPIEWVVAWILYLFHRGLTAIGMSASSGLSWVLSVVGLVVVIRILLIPLFVKQIKASRGMQLIAPELQAIQKKYKGKSDPASREAMSRETMGLYKKHGTSPFSSCLPILAQSPIFFALFRVLNALRPISEGHYGSGPGAGIGPINQAVAAQAEGSSIFGAQLSDTFMRTSGFGPAKVVTIVLIVLMSLTTFFTQRQLTMKNMPASALQGPMAKQQKMLMYMMPLLFAFSGVNFPIGVLVYWTTTNIWSMGQQFWVIRNNPTPGSEAARIREEKMRRLHPERFIVDESTLEVPRGQREQPKRQPRAKRIAAARPGDDSDVKEGAEIADSGEAAGGEGSTTKVKKSESAKDPGTAKSEETKASGAADGDTASKGDAKGSGKPRAGGTGTGKKKRRKRR